MPQNADCLFCRIATRELSSDVVWENDAAIAFRDIHPKAAVHVLVIPKQHIASLAEVTKEHQAILGELLVAVATIAQQLGIAESGFRTIINTREHGGQEVDHLHIHILGGEPIGPMRMKKSL